MRKPVVTCPDNGNFSQLGLFAPDEHELSGQDGGGHGAASSAQAHGLPSPEGGA